MLKSQPCMSNTFVTWTLEAINILSLDIHILVIWALDVCTYSDTNFSFQVYDADNKYCVNFYKYISIMSINSFFLSALLFVSFQIA